MPNPELHHHLKVLSEIVAACTKCDLHATRTQTVFSRGNPEAPVCIVGEGPGNEEDLAGLPFVGRSGQLLDQALQELGHNPATDIYVANVVKCRPPNNRRPTSNELSSCWSHIEQQLNLLPARVILTLGTTATHAITDQTKPITHLRGQVFKYREKACIPTYHPSFCLRSGGDKSSHYTTFKDDIQLAFNKSRVEQ